jgi:hypothetical protein
MKPGYKTSEAWAAVAVPAAIPGVLSMLEGASDPVKMTAIIVLGAVATGYMAARTVAKGRK